MDDLSVPLFSGLTLLFNSDGLAQVLEFPTFSSLVFGINLAILGIDSKVATR